MRPGIAVIAALAAIGVHAADGCVFDKRHQKSVVARAARSMPGQVVEAKDLSVTWRTDSKTTVRFTYGGCVDHGSVVQLREAGNDPWTDAKVLEVVLALVDAYWSERVLGSARIRTVVSEALSVSTPIWMPDANGRRVATVPAQALVEIAMSHHRESGANVVEVSWYEN